MGSKPSATGNVLAAHVRDARELQMLRREGQSTIALTRLPSRSWVQQEG